MTHETVPADEQTFTQKLISTLQAKMVRENPTTMHRDAHPKQHGLVKAQFEIENNLPRNLCHGVFSPGKIYDAWVRFSNNVSLLNDYDKDIRGAAIKLINVPGKKIPVADGNTSSQDFLGVSTPMFVTHDVKEFSQLVNALVKNKLCLIWFLLCHPRVAINLLRSNKRFFSPLEVRYWSTTPYLLGEGQVVKYSLIPHAKPTHLSEGMGPDFLRENMVKQLESSDYQFDFCVQLQKDPITMPVEDPGKEWQESESAFIKVATLTIPAQQFDTPQQNIYGRDMSFNPWHSLPAHKPLGGINRARGTIYDTLSKFRHRKNQANPIIQPTNTDVPEIK